MARGPRTVTSKGAGEDRAVTPHVARGPDVVKTCPQIAVIVTAAVVATVVTTVVMIVAGTNERQHKINDQTASGVRELMTLCTLALVRSLTPRLTAPHNELDNIAKPAEHSGPPGNSVTGVCGTPPQQA